VLLCFCLGGLGGLGGTGFGYVGVLMLGWDQAAYASSGAAISCAFGAVSCDGGTGVGGRVEGGAGGE